MHLWRRPSALWSIPLIFAHDVEQWLVLKVAAEILGENLRRYLAHEPLLAVVDKGKGY